MSSLNTNKNTDNDGFVQRLINYVSVNFRRTDSEKKLYSTIERQIQNNTKRIILKYLDFRHDKELFVEMSKLSKKELELHIKKAIEIVFKKDLTGFDVVIVN